jgi:Double zinc ribbon/Adenylate and Guanylate cyclase catalytic domain
MACPLPTCALKVVFRPSPAKLGRTLKPEGGPTMKCLRCQHENEAGAKFCEECAAPLVRTCVNCGRQLSPTAKFCPECAHPTGLAPGTLAADRFGSPQSYTPKHLAERILTSKAALEGECKQVTVLFADLKGSMELLADRDPEEARQLLDPVLERMMEAVHRYEGTVNQVMGDGIMALFGAPLAHEDHAVRACYAALRMQEAVAQYAEDVFRSHGIPIQIRLGRWRRQARPCSPPRPSSSPKATCRSRPGGRSRSRAWRTPWRSPRSPERARCGPGSMRPPLGD